VVLVLVAAAVRRRKPGGAWLAAAGILLGSWLVLVTTALVAAGPQYRLGLRASTVARPASDAPATAVLHDAYLWTSLLLVLAVLGAVLAARGEPRAKLLPAALAATALLAPAEQAGLHTTVSLHKHVVFGAWFAAIAAGYGMARLSRVDPGRSWAPVMALPIAAATAFGSMGQAAALYQVWPNATGAVSVLRSEMQLHPGHYLAEDDDVEAYYLRADVPWTRWSSTFYLDYQDEPEGAASYQAAIDSHYFSLVILDFEDTTATDKQITADMSRAGDYYVAARAGRYVIWASGRAPGRPAGGKRCRPPSPGGRRIARRSTCRSPPASGKSTRTSAGRAAGSSPGCSSRPPGCCTDMSG
jgi:hypothetical protein